MTIETSIIIPAYNESGRLSNGFNRLVPVLEQLGVDSTEVVIVDDGSHDGTMARAHEVYGHLPHTLFIQQPENRGKGAAIRLGIAVARGERLITADADMAIDPVFFPNILAQLGRSELAPGSRAEGNVIRYDSKLRTVAGSVFNRVVSHYTNVRFRDTQCGCKGFQLGPARLLGLVGMIDRFAFDAELLYLAQHLAMQITPVHVQWEDIEGSSVRVGHDSITMLRDIRALSRTRYENPVVELDSATDIQEIGPLAREARLQGLVLARGQDNALLVLPRDGSLGGLGVATALGGQLRTATLEELLHRTYVAV